MWKTKLKLNEGEDLRFERRCEQGHLGQEEVEVYSVVDGNHQVVGSVQYTDYTSIKRPHRRSFHLLQQDAAGNKVVDERWDG